MLSFFSAPQSSIKDPVAISKLNFDILAQGGGCTIEKTEERGITIEQLGNLLAFFEEHICGVDSFRNRQGEQLAWNTADLYDIVEHLVRPMTQQRGRSYVEAVASGPQVPRWFVSHWWGQTSVELATCLIQHSKDRELGDEVPYWICAFAAVQWTPDDVSDYVVPNWMKMYSTNQWYDPSQSPFQKAMRLAEGTVSVVDSKAGYFKRIWCCYEIWSSLMHATASNFFCDSASAGANDGYKYDIYTCMDDEAIGLTDGLAAVDLKRGKHWWTTNKYQRERQFPIELARSALSLRLELGQATQEADRVHILNTIIGSPDLSKKPPEEHARYSQLNTAIRGRFAAAMWRKGLETEQDMNLYARVLAASGCARLAISFDACHQVDDNSVRALASGLSSSIHDLDLDFNGCAGLQDYGLEGLSASLPSSLHRLKLDLSGGKFSSAGMNSLAAALAGSNNDGALKPLSNSEIAPSEVSFSLVSEAWELVSLYKDGSDASSLSTAATSPKRLGEKQDLQELALIFAGCGQLSEDSILAVINALPHSLVKLELNFYGCITLGDSCLTALAARIPPSLLSFELHVARCPDITDAGVENLAKQFPAGLQNIILDFRFCVNLTDLSGSAIAANLPHGIRQLEVDFVSCPSTTDKSQALLQDAVVGKNPNAKLTFWGKDDFSVNM